MYFCLTYPLLKVISVVESESVFSVYSGLGVSNAGKHTICGCINYTIAI